MNAPVPNSHQRDPRAVDPLEADLSAILGLSVDELNSGASLSHRILGRTSPLALAAVVGLGAVAAIAAGVLSQRPHAPHRETPSYAMALSPDQEPAAKAQPAPPPVPPSASLARPAPSAAVTPRREVEAALDRKTREAKPERRDDAAPRALAANEIWPSVRVHTEAPTELGARAPVPPAADFRTEDPAIRLARKDRLEAIDEVRLLRQK